MEAMPFHGLTLYHISLDFSTSLENKIRIILCNAKFVLITQAKSLCKGLKLTFRYIQKIFLVSFYHTGMRVSFKYNDGPSLVKRFPELEWNKSNQIGWSSFSPVLKAFFSKHFRLKNSAKTVHRIFWVYLYYFVNRRILIFLKLWASWFPPLFCNRKSETSDIRTRIPNPSARGPRPPVLNVVVMMELSCLAG